MEGFAIYRMPYASSVSLLRGKVYEIASWAELSGRQGFVMSPFIPTRERPIVVIGADDTQHDATDDAILERTPLGDAQEAHYWKLGEMPPQEEHVERDVYHIDFCNFHSHLMSGDFQKLVLARSTLMQKTVASAPLLLFRRACERYPRMFIALAYTAQSGLWLTATPEVLLAGSGRQWQTIALAGTMTWHDKLHWSEKNIQEQRYVATYITEQLEHFTDNFCEEGPQTVRAGHLAHLRSDFHFTLPAAASIGELINTLHPTPAVCGLPKREALQFIIQNEHCQRSYYSGFMGPLDVGGHTNLFVTLRCMQLFEDGYRLYAGGGLLKDSDEEQEWQETEAKLDTMRALLYNK